MNANSNISLLLSKLSDQPDTILTFDNDKKLQAHAAILRLHSPVLAQALKRAQCSTSSSTSSKKRKDSNTGSSNSSSSAGLKVMHITGTSKADFLVVAQFMYPVVPLPKVSWDNLEVLLLKGRKWDIQIVLALAVEFIQQHASSMDLTPTSRKYAFKWLQLVDAAQLTEACKACVDRILWLRPSTLQGEKLQGLSRQTLLYVVEKMGRVCTRIPAKRKFDWCCSPESDSSESDTDSD